MIQKITMPWQKSDVFFRSMQVGLTLLSLLLISSAHGQEQTFTNPIREGADPWVYQKDDRYYYSMSTGSGIAVSVSSKLTDQGTPVEVWKAPENGWNRANIWAPEIHFFDGHWYIYYAAGKEPGTPFIHQRSGVLKSVGPDPLGPYEDRGMLYTGDRYPDLQSIKWAIDLSPVTIRGQLYAIWSGWEENRPTDKTPQHLYIAKMCTPETICGNRVKLSSPDQAWERGGPLDLNEGPQLLTRGGETFIIYSTRESWLTEYRLGQLKLKSPGLDPLLPSNWVKSGPVFVGTDQVLGVGHCSFATSPDGSEHWLLYHSKKSAKPGWDRDIRLQPFSWDAFGNPVFGMPVPAGIPLPLPSGETE